ncbi:MAG: ABC-F family ATP-binding cassette domain-containing protein [Bacteroidaceae bacterium]|nr:ABC-F family ATP-binding cassette domain-containing protein [Bacteroidaceae bacterium]
MISVEGLCVEFSAKPLLTDISFVVNVRDRIALVGKNGAGKSTLLKILAGMQMPTSGMVSRPREMTIGYLPQVMSVSDTRTLEEETMLAFDGMQMEEWAKKAEMDKTLIGLGFQREDFIRPTSEFSGGWRMRIELAKILLQKPDLLLLDEPTNHLDIGSIQWLESFIQNSAKAVMVVSHDRAFINNITSRTIEITCGRINDYKVKYDEYVKLRDERREQQIRAYENQQKEIADIKEFVEKFRYKPTKSNQVQSRLKQLEKIVPIEIDQVDTAMLRLKFPPCQRSGDYPVICDEVEKSYGEHNIIRNVNLTIKRGEKVAFMGNNGEGKTTLVKCIMGEIPFEGNLKIGHNVQIGYFAQNQAQLLDGNITVFDTIDRVATGPIRLKIRDLLGAFMFGGEASDKFVKVLSGGERSRLAMIKLLLQPVNLLILDEPTNHLDMQSKDVLKNAIKDFDGTAIIVSHDRAFLEGLVDKVYVFKDHKVFEPIERSTLFQKEPPRPVADNQAKEAKTAQNENGSKENAPTLTYQQQKELAKAKSRAEKAVKACEEKIEKLETEIAEIEATLAEKNDMQLVEKYSKLQAELDTLMTEWERLSESLS